MTKSYLRERKRDYYYRKAKQEDYRSRAVYKLLEAIKKYRFIKKGDMATIRVKPTRPMVIEKASDFPELSRFAIRDMGMTIAAGIVMDIKPKA